jgi:creatinine amidohydrolase
MNRISVSVSLTIAAAAGLWMAQAQGPAPAAAQGKGKKGGGQKRVDLTAMARPIDMHDSVWIEDMTLLEIRDSLKAGKTAALIFAGGMDDNGPYITVSQHNSIVRAMCDKIARQLGNGLCAPILGIAPGNPEASRSPGGLALSAETFKAVLADEATSLKTEGFKNVLLMVDHGGDQAATVEVSKSLGEKWKGSGTLIAYVPEYYDYNEVETFERDVLHVQETREGYHDDYYTASISVAIDPMSARMPERIKAGKTSINGVDLTGSKELEDGKKIMECRADAAVKAIQKLVTESK